MCLCELLGRWIEGVLEQRGMFRPRYKQSLVLQPPLLLLNFRIGKVRKDVKQNHRRRYSTEQLAPGRTTVYLYGLLIVTHASCWT